MGHLPRNYAHCSPPQKCSVRRTSDRPVLDVHETHSAISRQLLCPCDNEAGPMFCCCLSEHCMHKVTWHKQGLSCGIRDLGCLLDTSVGSKPHCFFLSAFFLVTFFIVACIMAFLAKRYLVVPTFIIRSFSFVLLAGSFMTWGLEVAWKKAIQSKWALKIKFDIGVHPTRERVHMTARGDQQEQSHVCSITCVFILSIPLMKNLVAATRHCTLADFTQAFSEAKPPVRILS